MATTSNIMRNAYRKLDQLPLGFGLPKYSDDITDDEMDRYLGIDLLDAQRTMGIRDVSYIDETTIECMMLENRVAYHAIRRFRNSSAIFFKFSTAVDGKTVDKTKIPSTITDILKEYDDEFKSWKGSGISSTWNRS